MDLTQLANLGEFIGGVAVIGSLIFVGLQVRHSNKLASAETVRSFLHEYNAVMREGAKPEVSKIIRRAMVDFEALDNDDKTAASHQFITHMMLAQTAFMLKQRGLSDPDILNVAIGFNAIVINVEGVHPWWDSIKVGLDPAFVSFIESEKSKYPRVTDLLPYYRPNLGEA